MTKQQQSQDQQQTPQPVQQQQQTGDVQQSSVPDVDGLADKKPEELTPEELRLMADTMPGEGPGD